LCTNELEALFKEELREFDHSLNCLMWATQVVQQNLFSAKKKAPPSGLFLLWRARNLAISIRLLAAQGHEYPARVVLRALLETLDVATACIVDEDFASGYFPRKGPLTDHRELWKKKIGFGRVADLVDKALQTYGFSALEISTLRERRRSLTRKLNEAVHGSASAALLSGYVPSATHRGLLAEAPFGHLSDQSGALLRVTAEQIRNFMQILARLMMHERPPRLLSAPRASTALYSFLAFAQPIELDTTGTEPR
jgi:hypothetical protein